MVLVERHPRDSGKPERFGSGSDLVEQVAVLSWESRCAATVVVIPTLIHFHPGWPKVTQE